MANVENNDVKRFEHILKLHVQYEVENYIQELVRPSIDKLVKEVAIEATKNWATNISSQFDAMNHQTKIQINFVENIVKTVVKENDISIEVKE